MWQPSSSPGFSISGGRELKSLGRVVLCATYVGLVDDQLHGEHQIVGHDVLPETLKKQKKQQMRPAPRDSHSRPDEQYEDLHARPAGKCAELYSLRTPLSRYTGEGGEINRNLGRGVPVQDTKMLTFPPCLRESAVISYWTKHCRIQNNKNGTSVCVSRI